MAKQTIDGRMYPIGIQSFQKIIEEGYTYVDKTFLIAKLVKESQYVFLSRPRRFGKSLLLSTIQAYFEGRRELFKGLAIDSLDVDWTPRPVLYLDLNSGRYKQPGGLERRLTSFLSRYERLYDIEPRMEDDVVLRFEALISEVYDKTNKRVVILVDEYDKPLLELDENPGLFEENQSLLKEFFSNLKSMDDCIEFGMLTGVARFSKGSIFSDLNNLADISMENA
ncbi:MAG: AAA family ATPase, partial [Muribaculaceae bacterium]|nr:AAA family ATPase [Muribaculaceae bacterium]